VPISKTSAGTIFQERFVFYRDFGTTAEL